MKNERSDCMVCCGKPLGIEDKDNERLSLEVGGKPIPGSQGFCQVTMLELGLQIGDYEARRGLWPPKVSG